MNDTLNSRPWWRLHGATWLAVCIVLTAGVYLNANVADMLYRMKYGPVRPSLLIDGWPINAVNANVISAALHVDRMSLLANICVVLTITAGMSIKIELWRRKYRTRLRFKSEHFIALFTLAAVVLVLEIINRSDSLVDPIDYVTAFRWPALAVLFMGLALTCLTFVDLLGLLAHGATRRPRRSSPD